jgi:hypothetical protein
VPLQGNFERGIFMITIGLCGFGYWGPNLHRSPMFPDIVYVTYTTLRV